MLSKNAPLFHDNKWFRTKLVSYIEFWYVDYVLKKERALLIWDILKRDNELLIWDRGNMNLIAKKL